MDWHIYFLLKLKLTEIHLNPSYRKPKNYSVRRKISGVRNGPKN